MAEKKEVKGDLSEVMVGKKNYKTERERLSRAQLEGINDRRLDCGRFLAG